MTRIKMSLILKSLEIQFKNYWFGGYILNDNFLLPSKTLLQLLISPIALKTVIMYMKLQQLQSPFN